MVDECSGRGGHQAVALPAKILEVALEKEEATRELLLEMAMPVMQRKDWRNWTCLTCGREWSSSSSAQDTPQKLPTFVQAENHTVMRNSNPCLTEQTKQRETSTTSIPKAAPVGARLDFALARQTRARKAVKALDKMLTIAKQRMKETMEELEQASSAVEIAKKKVDQLQHWHRM